MPYYILLLHPRGFGELTKHATQAILEGAQPSIRQCWDAAGDRGHLFYRTFSRANGRTTQWAQRDEFLGAYTQFPSGRALLRAVTESGFPVPAPGDGVLEWLQAQGVWLPGPGTDGAILDAGMQHGVHCPQAHRADGANMVPAVFTVEVRWLPACCHSYLPCVLCRAGSQYCGWTCAANF